MTFLSVVIQVVVRILILDNCFLYDWSLQNTAVVT